MEEILKQLKEYLDKTDPQQSQKDWDELKEYNEIGPTVEEYVEFARQMHNKNFENKTQPEH